MAKKKATPKRKVSKKKAPRTAKKAKRVAMKASRKKKDLVLKSLKKDALTLMNLKVNEEDRKTLDARAKKFAKGNLSAWLRHAGKYYVPKKSELISQ